ncbi:UNVERIFIED_CONTAM: Lysine-specific histone demethylase 1A [Siphonaria sp. JEL0065]|nr:Lysine-specific histone demethylase 1A [Siphonaria sp. JEL0065]
MSTSTASGISSYDVIVVGAGISGLAAAESLRKIGCKSLALLEARDRIGGRILTQELQGIPVDLGASCIRGATGNPLLSLGLRLHSIENVLVFDQRGIKLNEAESAKLVNKVWAAQQRMQRKKRDAKADFRKSWNINELSGGATRRRSSWWEKLSGLAHSKPVPSTNTILTDLRQSPELDELVEDEDDYMSVREWLLNDPQFCADIANNTQYGSLLVDLINMLEITEGAPLDVISVSHHEKNEFQGPHLYVADGLWDLVKIAGGGILAAGNDTLKLNHEVIEIDYSADSDSTHPIVIHTNQGPFFAKTVIVTLPIGILRSAHTTLFHPPLSYSHQDALDRLEVGLIDKIVIEFPHSFWPSDLDGFWTFLPPKGVRRGMDFDEGQDTPGLVWFVNIAKVHRKKTTGEDGPPVLVGHVSQRHARRIEDMEDEEIEILFLGMLRKCFGMTEDGTEVVPEPLSFRVTRWQSDPFSMGACVFIPANASASVADVITLSEPIQYPLTASSKAHSFGCAAIHFAGEHTSPHHFGTVHGALMSGVIEAESVALELGLK